MDSVPMTILAAKHAEADLVAYSWIFEQSPQMDEREYSGPVCESLGISQQWVKCDALWPNFDSDTHCSPLFPFALPYGEFQQQTFRQAQKDKVTVMLSGLQGDLLYETDHKQVLGSLKRGQWLSAYREFELLRKQQQLTLWQAVKRYLLAPLPWVRVFLANQRARAEFYSQVLSSELAARLQTQAHWLDDESRHAQRPLQYQVVFDGFAGEDAMLGRVMENKYAVERRYPFRDRDLCEFMLAIPTEQLSKLGVKRPIVKRAFAAEFGPKLTARNDKTDFSQALVNGIERDQVWQQWLLRNPSYWQQYVKNCNLSELKKGESRNLVVLWQCAYYNFWHSVWYDPHGSKTQAWR